MELESASGLKFVCKLAGISCKSAARLHLRVDHIHQISQSMKEKKQ